MKKENLNIYEKTVTSIEKEFGKGSIFLLGSDRKNLDVEVFSTGSKILNELTGVGGFPKGRLIEVFGPESGGKTTLALHCIAQVQKSGGKAMYIDAEHALDPKYAKKIGVDIDNLLVAQPDSGEQAFEIMKFLISEKTVDVIVVDSVAALVPTSELNGDADTYVVGAQARMMSGNLRRINSLLSRSNTTIIFINQVREKIGVIYGNPEVTPGGRALKFFASMRVDIRQGTKLKQGQTTIGQEVKFKVVKNKMASPFKMGVSEIIYGYGICPTNEVINIALKQDVIIRKGIWYYYENDSLGQGKESVRKKLLNDTKLKEKIIKSIEQKRELVDK